MRTPQTSAYKRSLLSRLKYGTPYRYANSQVFHASVSSALDFCLQNEFIISFKNMVQICKFSSFLCICFICLRLIDLSLHRLSTPHEIWHLQKLHTNLRLLSFLTLKCTRHRSLYMLPHSGVRSLATKVAPSLDIARRSLHPILWINATFVNKWCPALWRYGHSDFFY